MARRRSAELDFPAIRIEGGLFPPDYLAKISSCEAPQQKDDDYAIPHRLKLRDEIGRYYRIASGLWEDFKSARDRGKGDLRKITTEKWLAQLARDVLGFTDIQAAGQETIGERVYPIGRVALGGRVPLVFAAAGEELDSPSVRYGDGARRRSPFLLAQEYLNSGAHSLWAIVSNGLTLRLLRDNPSLTRPAYIEFDLERIFDEELYADFVVLWLSCHATRFGVPGAAAADSPLERWRAASQEAGTRARELLRFGVADTLRILGSGFLAHPANGELRAKIQRGYLKDDEYYQQLLRLVYRLLFLFTIEERGLVFRPDATEEARDRFRRGYSLARLRDLAGARRRFDRHADLWTGLRIAMTGLSHGEEALGLPALGGLFRLDRCADLDGCEIANDKLLSAIGRLGFFQEGSALTRVNYRDMGPEELGSVYEALLELVPQIDPAASPWRFRFAGDDGDGTVAGNARKLTGSYYTPDSLVQELIKSALDPVIADRLKEAKDEASAILGIKVIDPACGSGHFLLASARRLGEALANARAGEGQPTPADYRHALRDVISHCIHGVDRNPLALELAKTALWLEAYSPDRPLGFLDHHMRCGDSLVGVLDPSIMDEGIPEEAFKPLSGDDPEVAKDLARRNTAGRKALKAERQRMAVMEELTRYEVESARELDGMPEETIEQIEAKFAAFEAARATEAHGKSQALADLFVAAFFTPKNTGYAKTAPITDDLHRMLRDVPMRSGVLEAAQKHARLAFALHWRLEFPEAFQQGGFDVVLGNPPWEMSQLNEQEFFSVRSPAIAALAGEARKRAIAQLDAENPSLWFEFVQEARRIEAVNLYCRASDRFRLTATGKLNTYALFAECFLNLMRNRGRSGFIVPTGIATDDGTKAYFEKITRDGRLASLYDFENRAKVFPAVDSRVKFSLLTLGRQESAEFVCFATAIEHLSDPRRRFQLSGSDIHLLNPNTHTCAIFRSERDAELTRKIYQNVPVLIDDTRGDGNPWGISFKQGLFNMTSDSGLFKMGPGQSRLPLYEAKMIHQFDHRFATYDHAGEETRDVTEAEKQDPDFEVRPRYWVDEREVLARIAYVPRFVAKAFADGGAKAIREAFAVWIAACRLNDGASPGTLARKLAAEFPTLKPVSDDEKAWLKVKPDAEAFPLEGEELRLLAAEPLSDAALEIFRRRSPKWLMGWRDITNATNERTIISTVIPAVGVGNNLPLFIPGPDVEPNLCACLIGNLGTLAIDFVARNKVGGTHLNYFIFKQLPVLSPDAYRTREMDYVLNRVVSLCHSSCSLDSFAKDCGCRVAPHRWSDQQRATTRAELDAWFAREYGLSRDELRYILDPAEVMGDDYPTETFRGLKSNELARHGEYRTRRLVLDAWDRLDKGKP